MILNGMTVRCDHEGREPGDLALFKYIVIPPLGPRSGAIVFGQPSPMGSKAGNLFLHTG
jgi:hypothetical protein